MTSTRDATKFFDAIARRYDRVYAKDRDASRRSLSRIIAEIPAEGRVLDLGVGTGRELSALLDAGLHPTGLDLSDEMLAICARRTRPVPLVKADMWQPLPFDDASFEAAIALHGTLAHPPSEGSTMELARELERVLAPGGVVIAEVPSPAWLEHATGERHGDFVLRRTGPNRCVHEDLVADVAVEAVVLSPREWRQAFETFAKVTLVTDDLELFIVART